MEINFGDEMQESGKFRYKIIFCNDDILSPNHFPVM